MELWFTEFHKDGVGITIKVKETLFSARSKYQEIAVVDTYDFGKMLVIDGLVMLTERDEFIYHEMMAHPALVVHPRPESVLVIGGGDGGTAREVLRHQRVRHMTLCEIDEVVIKACQEHFPGLSTPLTEDERAKVVVEDAIAFIKASRSAYDVILVDSSDPVGPAKGLFGKEFLSNLKEAVRDGGIVALQSESPFYHGDIINEVKRGLKGAGFRHIYFYWAPIPTYPGGVWCWAIASDTYHPISDLIVDIDQHEPQLFTGKGLKYYDLEVHRASFVLPRYVRDYLSNERGGHPSSI